MPSIARGLEFPPCEDLGTPWLVQVVELEGLVDVAFERVNEGPLEYCIRFSGNKVRKRVLYLPISFCS